MTNTTNIITLEIPEEETAILSCVIRQVSRELEERIADAGKDEPHLAREALDALTLHMEVELGCVNRLAAALEDAVDAKSGVTGWCEGCGVAVPVEDFCGNDREDGTGEFLCPECYVPASSMSPESQEYAQALDSHAVREPLDDEEDLDDDGIPMPRALPHPEAGLPGADCDECGGMGHTIGFEGPKRIKHPCETCGGGK